MKRNAAASLALVGTTQIIHLLCLASTAHADFNEDGFLEVVKKLEADVIELAEQMERRHEGRCETMSSSSSSCEMNNYHRCLSALPNPTCSTSEAAHYAPICSSSNSRNSSTNLTVGMDSLNATSCERGALFDDTVSSISVVGEDAIKPTYNDAAVVEAICFSRHLDDWWTSKWQNDSAYWSALGMETSPRAAYFGSSATGAFRSYPARPTQQCSGYDPRLQPWYIAASSAPKNVVLILDISKRC
jgi:hypothetical protein